MAVYLVCYIISFILARQHFYMLSGLVLITAALWLYIKDYRETGNLIHLRGLFCLFLWEGRESPALSSAAFRRIGVPRHGSAWDWRCSHSGLCLRCCTGYMTAGARRICSPYTVLCLG